MDIHFDITIFLQRAIELLALYLILANLNGKGLKEAFTRLFIGKQRIFYENIALLVGYLVAITFVIQTMGHTGHIVNHVIQPFMGLLLIKKADLRQALLAIIIVPALSSVVMLLNVFISLPALANYGLVLVITILVTSLNYLYKMYMFLVKRPLFLNILCVISFLIYLFPVVVDTHLWPLFFAIFLLGFYMLIKFLTNSGTKKDLQKTIDLIANASYDELMLFLEELSNEHTHTELMAYFIIEDQFPPAELIDALSVKLGIYKKDGIFRDFACRAIDEQIKISIIL